jgi:hypothetical protein
MARGKAKTTASAAIRYCLAHNAVTCAMPGLSDIRHVREALSAIEEPMTKQEQRMALRTVAKIGRGFCRNCGYCKPCQQGIDINNVFRFYHYCKDYDLKSWARRKYRALKVKADKCKACGTCKPKCPYHIDIPARLRAAHRALAMQG